MKDAVVHGNAVKYGKLVIFPSTYTGGLRNLHEYAQDATTYLRYGGKPSFFITYTINPVSKKSGRKPVQENRIHGQSKKGSGSGCKKFKKRNYKFMHVLTKGQVFGKFNYWLYSIEWQNRGLSHAHILIWLLQGLNPNQIDENMSDEIPNPQIDKKLQDIVIRNMVHGPCSTLNPK